MASNTLDGLKAEIDAALTVLAPQIGGLEDYSKFALSPTTQAVVAQELSDHIRRRTLLQNVLKALDRLNAAMDGLTQDGYPVMPKLVVSQKIFQELQDQVLNMKLALGEFVQEGPASNLSVSLGTPAPKPL